MLNLQGENAQVSAITRPVTSITSILLLLLTCLAMLSSCGTGTNSTLNAPEDTPDIGAAANVIECIDNLGNDYCAADLLEIKAAYSNLTDEQKDYVTNYSVLEALEQHYSEALLIQIYSTLTLNIDTCATIRNTTSEVWNAAIKDKYADFNNALSNLYKGQGYRGGYDYSSLNLTAEQAEAFVGILDAAKENQQIIEADLAELYKMNYDSAIFDALMDVYEEYCILYGQAMSPTGSYATYCSETNEAMNDITKKLATLNVMWPFE